MQMLARTAHHKANTHTIFKDCDKLVLIMDNVDTASDKDKKHIARYDSAV